MFDLTSRVAVVTGGATGLGFAMARMLACQGAQLVLAGRRQTRGQAAVEILAREGIEAHFISTDVTVEDQVKQLFEQVIGAFQRVDILINNAGASNRQPLTEVDAAEWDRVFAVNVKGAFLSCKYVLPVMIQQHRGVILNISSFLGWRGGTVQNLPAYSAAKGALITLTKSLAVSYGPLGIRVNALCPGFVVTDFNREVIEQAPDPEEMKQRLAAANPLGRLGEPEDVAYAALFLVSDEASWISGAILPVDGGAAAR